MGYEEKFIEYNKIPTGVARFFKSEEHRDKIYNIDLKKFSENLVKNAKIAAEEREKRIAKERNTRPGEPLRFYQP